MCGIAGLIGQFENADEKLHLMLSNLIHRGPDDLKKYRNHNFFGGMTRLAINGLDNGEQPFLNSDHSVAVLYNGEIYNYLELKNFIESKNIKFTGDSDGEIIPHLYDLYGENVFEHLDGMFAIAIWDSKKNQLLLGRDFPGEKPLYYSDLEYGLIFSSEVRAIEAANELTLTIDRQAIWDFPSFLWIPEPRTAFNEIKALRRGHYLQIVNNKINIKPFTPKLYSKKFSFNSDNDAINQTRVTVKKAITSRLLSDVPVGCFLSGGLDSSIVATIASSQLPTLDTFTVSFENIDDPYHGKADESKAAEHTAKRIGSKHHTISVTANDFKSNLNNFIKYGDLPFSVSSGLGIMSVSKEARSKGIKVLLTGDGADECFGGYSWYENIFNCDKEVKKEEPNYPVSFQNIGLAEKERTEILNSMSPEKRAFSWHYYAHEIEKDNLFIKEWSYDLKTSLRYFSSIESDHKPLQYIKHDRNFYFPNEMLRKVDRMGMANSVEGRSPFASPEILSLSNSLKEHHMFNEKKLKWILREAFKNILTIDVFNRPKHGFNVPIDHWLKNDWFDLVQETFEHGSELHKLGVIKPGSMDYALKLLNDRNRLNGHTLFSFIVLNKWLNRRNFFE